MEYLFWLLLPVLLFNQFAIEHVFATDEEHSRLYSTREERRDAGIKHAITPWFIVSGFAEIETEWQKFNLRESDSNDYVKASGATLQFGFNVIPTDWIQVEILTEFDTDVGDPVLDEATLAFEYDDWELKVGKQTLDFGVFYSHFARLEKELEKLRKNSDSIAKKLENKNFVDRAPAVVVEKERERLEENNVSIEKLEGQHQRISTLNQ